MIDVVERERVLMGRGSCQAQLVSHCVWNVVVKGGEGGCEDRLSPSIICSAGCIYPQPIRIPVLYASLRCGLGQPNNIPKAVRR